MSRYKKVVNKCYRFEEELDMMIKETSEIMQRTESDAVRIMLFNSCRYWMTKSVKKPTLEEKKGYERQQEPEDTEEEMEALMASIAHLK